MAQHHLNYAYVDGESHWHCAEKLWKRIHGEDADLRLIQFSSNLASFPRSGHGLTVVGHANFFWDTLFESQFELADHVIDRKVYFTSFTGNDPELHKVKTSIRKNGFEPSVTRELKDLARQRANRLEKDGLVIKPKGVDIGLAVRILEDAYQNNFNTCILATSDVDYLPVIEVIRRMGKRVFVLAFSNGLTTDSPFYFVPERLVIIDEPFMRKWYSHASREPTGGD
jgi:uncharacterized LabA/DUF88 family protein